MSRPVVGTPSIHLFHKPVTSVAPRHALHVVWYKTWHSALDEALHGIPENDICPHELFRLLAQTPGPTEKLVAMVMDELEPVAVIGLRRTGRICWVPITQWIIPGEIFPTKVGFLLPALEALNTEVRVAWWRMGCAPPVRRMIRHREPIHTYGLRFSEGYEKYWRESGHWNTVKKCRNRCSKFSFAVNKPDSAEWTIKNWELRWRNDPNCIDPSLPDRIAAAHYLENRGQHYSFLLLEGEKPIAGHTFVRHDDDLVWQVSYRDPAYDWHGVGTRLMDQIFSWGEREGFEAIDMGGWHDYKIRWAPQQGEHWCFSVCPEYLFRMKQVVRWLRTIRQGPFERADSGCECDSK